MDCIQSAIWPPFNARLPAYLLQCCCAAPKAQGSFPHRQVKQSLHLHEVNASLPALHAFCNHCRVVFNRVATFYQSAFHSPDEVAYLVGVQAWQPANIPRLSCLWPGMCSHRLSYLVMSVEVWPEDPSWKLTTTVCCFSWVSRQTCTSTVCSKCAARTPVMGTC